MGKYFEKARDTLKALATDTTGLTIAFLLLAAIYSYFANHFYSNYLLVGDDPANIAGTLNGAPFSWFTKGMSGYYHVYPEWRQEGFSNFYRPV